MCCGRVWCVVGRAGVVWSEQDSGGAGMCFGSAIYKRGGGRRRDELIAADFCNCIQVKQSFYTRAIYTAIVKSLLSVVMDYVYIYIYI